ncbi:hypothetical protein SAMN04487980_104820 [Streptomyces sp. cf124]|nr:hypothetical protein SAMN04487980_104820 [Streptomyces sp. cf124]
MSQVLSRQVNRSREARAPTLPRYLMKLVYVFDAYCGWSHGFSATLSEFTSRESTSRHPELPGVEFGEDCVWLIPDGSFLMASQAAARGVADLRLAAPERAAEWGTALQRAFYVDGLSLCDPATYRKIAAQAGLDADAAEPNWASPVSPPSRQWTAHASSPWPAATPPPRHRPAMAALS